MARFQRACRWAKKRKSVHQDGAGDPVGLLSLPPELLVMICKLVSDRDLLALTCTNRLFRELAHDDSIMWQQLADEVGAFDKFSFDQDGSKAHLNAKERCLILRNLLCWSCHAVKGLNPSGIRLRFGKSYCRTCANGLGLGGWAQQVYTSVGGVQRAFGLKRAELQRVPVFEECVEWLPILRPKTDERSPFAHGSDTFFFYPYWQGNGRGSHLWLARSSTILPGGMRHFDDFRFHSCVTYASTPSKALDAALEAGSTVIISSRRKYYRRQDLCDAWKAKLLETQREEAERRQAVKKQQQAEIRKAQREEAKRQRLESKASEPTAVARSMPARACKATSKAISGPS